MDLLTHHFYKIVKVGFVNTLILYIYAVCDLKMYEYAVFVV